MIKYLSDFQEDFDKYLNRSIMNNEFDQDLNELIFESFKGLEILPNIKILGYQYDADESHFDINNHIVRRNTNKKKLIKSIAETRAGIMYIDIEVSGKDKDGKQKIHYLKKPLIVPIKDKKGFYLIKGKKYRMIYQLVDKMHYPSMGAVTIKSLMPICIKTTKHEFAALNEPEDSSYTIPTYTIQIFKAGINVLMLYSHLGVTKMLNFMEVNRFISVHDKSTPIEYRDDRLYFDGGKKSNIIVSVLKDAFDKLLYVKSITGCLIQLFEETKIKYDDIDNYNEWMILVGGKNTVRRGQYQHIFFNRLLDDITRREIKIDEYDKQNIYYLVRWILQNYHALWEKDNLSMMNKRLRFHETIVALLTFELSKKVNRIVSMGDKATIKEYMDMFKFPQDVLINKIYTSGILRFSESNNAIDFGSKFAYTKKGPQSLGGTNTKRIPIRQRLLHPSMLGYVDIATISSSDPGQSGSLSPWNPLTSMYFDDSLADNHGHYDIKKYLDEHPLSEDDAEELVIQCDNEKQYNEVLNSLFQYTDQKLIVSGVSTNDNEIIIEPDPQDTYRKVDEDMLFGVGQ